MFFYNREWFIFLLISNTRCRIRFFVIYMGQIGSSFCLSYVNQVLVPNVFMVFLKKDKDNSVRGKPGNKEYRGVMCCTLHLRTQGETYEKAIVKITTLASNLSLTKADVVEVRASACHTCFTQLIASSRTHTGNARAVQRDVVTHAIGFASGERAAEGTYERSLVLQALLEHAAGFHAQ